MIWKTKTHEFTATMCQHTGKPCPALARLARAMAQAMGKAVDASGPEFEIEGSSDLTHCTDGCTARFRAGRDRIRLFCGADPEAEMDGLDDYADMMFGAAFNTLPSGIISKLPCAMLEVRTLAPRMAARPRAQISV